MLNGTFTLYTYDNGVWTPTQPTIAVGESFWINKSTGTEWKQNISLWP